MIDDEALSRSQKKREHHAVQSLAGSLAALSPKELDRIPLSGALREAVDEAAGLRRGALQRQVRFIAKRLAAEDVQAVSAAYESLRHGSREETARLHRIERWRERLLEDGPQALSEFIAGHPRTDRQQLRALIRSARREREQERPPKASRRLFGLLKGLVE